MNKMVITTSQRQGRRREAGSGGSPRQSYEPTHRTEKKAEVEKEKAPKVVALHSAETGVLACARRPQLLAPKGRPGSRYRVLLVASREA